jgi:hypothetical protein
VPATDDGVAYEDGQLQLRDEPHSGLAMVGGSLRVWHHEGHFASVVREAEIVRELLSRSA